MHELQPEDIENQVFPTAIRGYDREKVDGYLRVVAAYYREAIRAAQVESQSIGSPSKPFEALGNQVAAILGTASAAAEDLRMEANRDAQRIRAVAAAEAEEMTQAATNQLLMAQQMKAQAQKEAEALRAEVSEETSGMQREARERIAAIESDARDRIARMEEAARLRVDAFLEEGQRRQEMLREAEMVSAANLRKIESTLQRARAALTANTPTSSARTDLSGDNDAMPPSIHRVGPYRRERIANSGTDDDSDSRSWHRDDQAANPPRAEKAGVIDVSARSVRASDRWGGPLREG